MTIKMRLSKMLFFLPFRPPIKKKFKVGPLLTLFSNPLPTPLLTRPLKNYFYRHFGVSDYTCTSVVITLRLLCLHPSCNRAVNGGVGMVIGVADTPACIHVSDLCELSSGSLTLSWAASIRHLMFFFSSPSTASAQLTAQEGSAYQARSRVDRPSRAKSASACSLRRVS